MAVEEPPAKRTRPTRKEKKILLLFVSQNDRLSPCMEILGLTPTKPHLQTNLFVQKVLRRGYRRLPACLLLTRPPFPKPLESVGSVSQ